MAFKRTPELKSFLVADRVIQEKGTDKWSVIGVFDRIWGSKFPLVHPSLGIFVKVADVEGDHPVVIDLRDTEDKLVGKFEGMGVKVEGSPQVVAFGVQTFNLAIPKAGREPSGST